MIDIIERRAIVERILRVARDPDPIVARRFVYSALEDARQEGGKESTILLAAIVIQHLGGQVSISNDALAAIDVEHGGVTYSSRADGVVVEAVDKLTPAQLDALARARKPGDLVTQVSMPDDGAASSFPPANLEEPADGARDRICAAVRMLVDRYYFGEFRSRGYAFGAAVFTELLAMQLGILRGQQADPAPIEQWLETFVSDLVTRVEGYQRTIERIAPTPDLPTPTLQ